MICSRQYTGHFRYPCLNARQRKNGKATFLEKNVLPMLAARFLNAYRTHRTTTSSKTVER